MSANAPERCAHAIAEPVLVDYWIGILGEAEEQEVEEHLFACGACASRATEMKALADVLSGLAREGNLRVVVSDELLRQASARGLKVREYAARPGDIVECTVIADDDLLVARLVADLPPMERVDLCWCTEHGDIVQRFSDIPHMAGASEVVFQQSIRWAKAGPTASMVARLVSVDAQGVERVLGEYVFRHTRTLPGPGSWAP